ALAIIERRDKSSTLQPEVVAEIEALAAAAVPSPADIQPANGTGRVPEPTIRVSPESLMLKQRLPEGVRTVVIVEDTSLVRSICARILQDEFLVFETDNGVDALQLAEQLPVPFHLLLSDVCMPNLDGRSLARLWRDRRPESSVLLFSGADWEPDEPEVQIAFLRKPFTQKTLVEAARRLTARAEHALNLT
ncbi:MAG: response regulator, partial [Gemmataceae bacterium]|nr:response regulator [Gemmataceae bacterium]